MWQLTVRFRQSNFEKFQERVFLMSQIIGLPFVKVARYARLFASHLSQTSTCMRSRSLFLLKWYLEVLNLTHWSFAALYLFLLRPGRTSGAVIVPIAIIAMASAGRRSVGADGAATGAKTVTKKTFLADCSATCGSWPQSLPPFAF